MNMKKVFTFICCLAVVLASLLFGGSMFCSNIVSHSLVDVAINQIHMEEKLTELFAVLQLPDAQSEAAMVDTIIKEVMEDEKVMEEMNKFTDSFVADLVNDETSEITSNLNQTIKDKVITYANDLSVMSNHLLSENDIAQLLSEGVDIVDVEGLYQRMVSEAKASFSATQKLLLKSIHFLQSDLCYYGSLIAMLTFSILIIVLNLAWLQGLVPLSVAWLISAILMFIISKAVPTALTLLSNEAQIAEGISDNVSQLSFLSGLYFAIFIICVIAKVIYNRLFIKD